MSNLQTEIKTFICVSHKVLKISITIVRVNNPASQNLFFSSFSYFIENQLTGFYMMATLAINELMYSRLIVFRWKIFKWPLLPITWRRFHRLYVLIKTRTRFRVNLHSIVVWMSRNSLLKTGSIFGPVWLNGWVFVNELNGCGFESHCSHLRFHGFFIFSNE